jgi:putative ABC transport system permease protein
MGTLVGDVRYGLRMLARTPGATAVALLALALGIGANTAIFSVVYAVLLRPFPVRDPARLVAIHRFNQRFNIPPIPPGYDVYAEWRREATSFESLAAASASAALFTNGAAMERVLFWKVSSSFLATLGVHPVLGREFLPQEDVPGGARVAMLSGEFWKQRFASDPQIVGKSIKVDGAPYNIVGVLPAGFHVDGKPADIYAPLALPDRPKDWVPVSVYARVKPGLIVRQAHAEMDTLARLHDPKGWGWRTRVGGLRESMVHDVRLSLLVLLSAVGLVLLLACANVASMLLAKSGARQREMAIRTALGAGRRHLVRQVLTESTLLALLGAAAGVLMATWCTRLVPLIEDERLPNLLAQTRVDSAVLAFTLAISVLTGLIFGAGPAFSVSQARVQEALQEGGRAAGSLRRRRAWSVLVISETALALILMAGAMLLIRSFFYLRDVAPGFRVDGLLTASLSPAPGKYGRPEQLLSLYERVLEKVRGIPGVQAATLASTLPLCGEYQSMSMPIEGHRFARLEDVPVLWYRTVDKDYFRTMRIPLRRGRAFTDEDRLGAQQVAIINEVMARRFWPGQNPLGKHLGGGGREWFEIVGVAANVRHQNATEEPLTEVFFSALQSPPAAAMLALRVDPGAYQDPLAVAPSVERTVVAVDKDQQLTRVRDMLQIASSRLAPKRLTAALIAAFAGLALVLAAVGIFGVLSFAVSQRTHEIGLRVALGAQRRAVLRMIVGQAARLALAGVLVGTAGALALGRVIRSLLFGVSATDPIVFTGVAAVLLAVAMAAAYIPARRAAGVEPVIALRHE